ncbi:hypothetical protein cce_4215 [Crocosphaera subtropica ATCC 51142]|uniref:Uncharacterized protein n=1 Tax=Crocosphaera subtropica (strain ATCC 51142 / BH68) TaxID=43989 RepID=B1WSI4_CROS5|nr:hypothetical protein cce_4215 [Crocosphaera subtropica ATCC 51142]
MNTMNPVIINQKTTIKEQKLILPGWYDWQQFIGVT